MRLLSPRVMAAVSFACAGLSAFVLLAVFFPSAKGTQYYLTVFLAATLPLTFLTHRGTLGIPTLRVPARWRRRTAGGTRPDPTDRSRRPDDPGPLDWLLASVALAVCLYPLIDFDGFLERRQLPTAAGLRRPPPTRPPEAEILAVPDERKHPSMKHILTEARRLTRVRGRTGRLAAVALAVVFTTAGCGGKQTDGSATHSGGAGGRLTIATGNTTGVYYQLGGGLAQQISDHIPGYRATATATGASVQNIQGVVSGSYDIAFSLLDTASDAVAGAGSFSQPQPVEALARLYPNYTQVIVRADSGITSVADMKGKRISTGSPGSGTEVIAHRILEAAGLHYDKDVQAQRLGLPETVDAMKDGTVDALFWSGGLPTGGITDLTTGLKEKVRFLDVSPQLGALQQYGQVYQPGLIPVSVYKQAADVPTVVVPNVLVVKKGFDPVLAGKIVGLIIDRRSELEHVNPAATEIGVESAALTGSVPLNTGARQALSAR